MVLSIVQTVVAAPSPIDFNRDIRPLFSENCFTCHGPDKEKRKAGLRVDSREEITRVLESGHAAVVPGKPEESQLLKAIALPNAPLRMGS